MQRDGACVNPRWYEDAFGEAYEIIYAHRSVEAAEPEARFAVETLRLGRSDLMLDLGCGTGRHLVHLFKHAGACVGLDYSPALLRRARNVLPQEVGLVRADMRAIPLTSAFTAVTSFFTSFGYFLDREENLRVVQEVARVLRPGGRFLIDHANATHVERALEPEGTRRHGSFEIRETRWIDAATRRVNKTTRLFRDGRELERTEESVQLYSQTELRSLLAEAGLRVEAVYGDYEGSPLDDARPRMLMIGCKA
ncbi:MAG: methyltransferase domain-containing protein [Candidatus Hydrogenedentes bacterium]|nr:methyltransferase domain-containing protein [Candidatus Hydrogenedentota bacterium]